jgi:hypothetical protein
MKTKRCYRTGSMKNTGNKKIGVAVGTETRKGKRYQNRNDFIQKLSVMQV